MVHRRSRPDERARYLRIQGAESTVKKIERVSCVRPFYGVLPLVKMAGLGVAESQDRQAAAAQPAIMENNNASLIEQPGNHGPIRQKQLRLLFRPSSRRPPHQNHRGFGVMSGRQNRAEMRIG